MKKTIASKKLSLNVHTLRTLTDESLSDIIGGKAQGIVSTDTPSFCFDCPERRRKCPPAKQ